MDRIKFQPAILCSLYLALTTLILLASKTRQEKSASPVASKVQINQDKSQLDSAVTHHSKPFSVESSLSNYSNWTGQLDKGEKVKIVTRDARANKDDGQLRKLKPRRRHLRVATIEAPPFMMKRKSGGQKLGDNNGDQRATSQETMNATDVGSIWHGYCMDFFLELIKHLPYEVTYEIYEAPDGKFGSKIRQVVPVDTVANKSNSSHNDTASGGQEAPRRPVFKKIEYWNGLIGELQRGRAQLALAPMAVMAEREIEIDFTVPFYDLVGIQILLKRPEVPQNWFKFLTVLDNDVWISIGLAYFVTSFMIYIFDRLSPYSHKNLTRIERMRNKQQPHSVKHSSSSPDWTKSIDSGPANRMHLLRGAAIMPDKGGSKFYLSRPLANIGDSLPGGAPIDSAVRTISGKRHFADGSASSALSPDQRDFGQLNSVDGSDYLASRFKRRRASHEYIESLRSCFSLAGEGNLGAPSSHKTDKEGNFQEGDRDDNHDDDHDDDSNTDGKPDFNLRDSLWFCITSLTPQGGGEAPQNLSGRIVAGAWWLFCFIVIASYTANLAAFLTVSRLDIPIESLDDLAKQYRIKYAPIDGTAERTYFERMAYIEEIFYNIWKNMSLNDSLSETERSKFAVWDYPISDKYTKIWSQIQEIQMPASFQEALERVRAPTLDDGFALLADANLVKYAVMTDCSLKAVGDEFSRKPMALAVQKGHDELREDVSYAILQLINQRFMEVLREKWWTNNPARVICDSNDESEGISIENIGGVFIIILAGILLSFLVWAIERFVYTSKIDVSRELLHLNNNEPNGIPLVSHNRLAPDTSKQLFDISR